LRITIKKIAEVTGVSKSAVDRALKNQGGVSEETRKKVLKTAKELGYTPNSIGRALRLQNETIKFALVSDFRYVDLQVKHGAQRAQSELKDFGVELKTYKAPDVGYEGQVKALCRIKKDDSIKGVILKAKNHAAVSKAIDEVVESGKPVVTVVSDQPGTRRLYYIGQNHYKSGRVAGSLMHIKLMGKGNVIIFEEANSYDSYKNRLRGFRDAISERPGSVSISEVLKINEGAPENYEIALNMLKSHNDVQGIFVTGASHSEIAEALKDVGRSNEIVLIGYDILKGTYKQVKEGAVDFVITQNPYYQGYEAVKVLFNNVFHSIKPQKHTKYMSCNIWEKESIPDDYQEANELFI